jgi:cytochrome c oxidase subunit II
VNIPSSIITLLIGIVVTLVSLWYGQESNSHLLPVAASAEASLVDGLFSVMLMIGTGLFLLVLGIIVYSAIKFRRQPGDETDGPPVHGNIPLEILWTAIPAVIVLGLGVYSFDVYNEIGGLNPMDHSVAHGHASHQMAEMKAMPGAAIAATLDAPPQSITEGQTRNQDLQDQATQDPTTDAVRADIPQKKDAPTMGVASPRIGASPDQANNPNETVVNVAGMQYAWIFTYPDSGVVSGELHVPVGRKVYLNITANDVLHAFWVPEYRLKQDAVPGRQTELQFTPTVIGEYPMICAELCGPYHGVMKTKVIAESPADYQAWIDEQRVASAEGLKSAIASNPAEKTDSEFLAPYVDQMGIETQIGTQALDQLHSEHLRPAA